MCAKVLTRQLFHFAVALHIEVGTHRIIGQTLRRGAQIVELGQLFKAQLADVAAGGETIKNQLTQLQIPARTIPVLVWRILNVAAPLTPHPALSRNLGAPATTGHVLALHGRAEILKARLHFRMGHQHFFNNLLQTCALGIGLLCIQRCLGHCGARRRHQAQRRYHLCNLAEFHFLSPSMVRFHLATLNPPAVQNAGSAETTKLLLGLEAVVNDKRTPPRPQMRRTLLVEVKAGIR